MREENTDRLLKLADREPDELTEEESRELFALGEELRGEIRAITHPSHGGAQRMKLARPETPYRHTSAHKCSVCGEQADTQLDARIVHAAGIFPQAKYCPHCGQYPASIFTRT